MADTEEDAKREQYIADIVSNHQDEIRDQLFDEIRDELLWDDEFLEEALELHGEDRVVWVKITDDEIQLQINKVASALKKLLATIAGDNRLTSQKSLMHDFERKQLIALLEVALIEFKAPYVDRGRLRGIGSWLARIANRAFEKEATQTMQDALSTASNETKDLLSTLDTSEVTKFF